MSVDSLDLAENMIATLKKAGDCLRSLQLHERQVLSSQGKDIKLEADIRAEEIILSGIREFSSFPVLSEEKGWTGSHIGQDEYYWVVDPLDGSYNFLRGQPMCCTSLALCKGETPYLGALYDFQSDMMYVGGIDYPAAANGQPLSVANTSDIKQACVMTGLPVGGTFDHDGLSELARFIAPWKKVRMIGSATLSLAYVAAGKADFYRENGIFWWDVAAGLAIISAAGGTYSIKGDVYKNKPLEVRAGVTSVFDQVLKLEI